MIALLFLTWLFVGHVSYYDENEPKGFFFVKKYPTFKIEFYKPDDPYANYFPSSKLSPDERKSIIEYCKYRYGMVSAEIAKIEECRQRSLNEVIEETGESNERPY
jgi:hypothetical protein